MGMASGRTKNGKKPCPALMMESFSNKQKFATKFFPTKTFFRYKISFPMKNYTLLFGMYSQLMRACSAETRAFVTHS